jgi:hypothetical protein
LSQANIVRAANRRICDFVHRSANRKLLPGTGYYSTPFRGGLFGETESDAVAKQLSRSGVDVLWLGTNPCVARSLENIIHPPTGKGDFPTFEHQMESGLFGSCLWDSRGNRSPDWNPIERPAGNWHVYRDMLSKIARLERVAMSNFLPWGSKNADVMVKRLCATNRLLLDRMLEFADDLNAEIVETVAPKLLVVPLQSGSKFSVRSRAAARPHACASTRLTRAHNRIASGSVHLLYRTLPARWVDSADGLPAPPVFFEARRRREKARRQRRRESAGCMLIPAPARVGHHPGVARTIDAPMTIHLTEEMIDAALSRLPPYLDAYLWLQTHPTRMRRTFRRVFQEAVQCFL